MRCSIIVPDHSVKLAGHSQNLVGQCQVTICYLQHWFWDILDFVFVFGSHYLSWHMHFVMISLIIAVLCKSFGQRQGLYEVMYTREPLHKFISFVSHMKNCFKYIYYIILLFLKAIKEVFSCKLWSLFGMQKIINFQFRTSVRTLI